MYITKTLTKTEYVPQWVKYRFSTHFHCEQTFEGGGLEKATRGGEWEPIKKFLNNLSYILKLIRRPSLLTRPRPHSYSKVIGLQNRVSHRSGNTKQC
jgi:hypothetical protein